MDHIEENQSAILTELLARAEKKGDLPIFNASLNNVRRISSDPEAHAMELAQTIMKDANLSVKLLRIANSPYYSRGAAKISSVSRAVVVLGFDVIKSLCLTLKLIESFSDEHPTVGMHKMVARSYLAAGFVRDVALRCNIKNAEETYVCGLCHSIGEIAVGYFMPEKFEDILRLQRDNNVNWEHAQQRILDNLTLVDVGQELAKSWNFSDRVIKSMAAYHASVENTVRNPYQLSHAIVSLGSDVVDNLYLKDSRNKKTLRELFNLMEQTTAVRADLLEKTLAEAFTRSCELIKNYGLSPIILQPALSASDTNDTLRDKLTRDFSFFVTSQAENNASNLNEAPTTEVVTQAKASTSDAAAPVQHEHAAVSDSLNLAPSTFTPGQKGDPLAQLTYIQEITSLVTEGAPLSALFLKLLQGLKEGVGFDRVALSLVTPDRSLYATRLSLGDAEGCLKNCLRGRTSATNSDLFARIIDEGNDLLVSDLADGTWAKHISADFLQNAGTSSFIIAGLKRGPKPIGLFYADNATSRDPITPMMRRGFLQFVAQARLAVQIVN